MNAVKYWLLSWWWQASYAVRPYDMLADRRRWFWQRRTRCGLPPMTAEQHAALNNALDRIWRKGDPT